jgi:hypothetical protein
MGASTVMVTFSLIAKNAVNQQMFNFLTSFAGIMYQLNKITDCYV